MKSGFVQYRRYVVCLCLLLTCCSGSEKARGDKEKEPFIIVREPEEPRGIRLARSDSSVQSIQLYRSILGTDRGFEENAEVETQFPFIALGSSDVLKLEFDMLEYSGRPLSVYFYHADKDWRKDLSPAEYLATFQRDNIVTYTPSRATDVAYTHYAYQFPNESISFLLSGNYIVRITEQGREDQVLFERPFFVTEQITSVQLGIENVFITRGGFSAVQPAALFLPPASFDTNVFDYAVCFSRNGRFEAARCSDQPSLSQPPAMRFFLQPSQAFQPVTADYFLDISALRVGNRIERIAFNEAPFYVTLESDFARFPGDLLDPILNGQTLISGVVNDVAAPDVSAQYVDVLFSYVTETARPVAGTIYLTGSFNGWTVDPRYALEWNTETEQYEIELLLKQGQYDYRYVQESEDLPRGTVPRPENLYTAFVYYSDIRRNTDRLLAVNSLLAQ